MKITEHIERDCCTYNDLLPYEGRKNTDLKFCKYCGKIHIKVTRMDDSGHGKQIDWQPISYDELIILIEQHYV